MDIFSQHEIFEMWVLDQMNSARLLEPLVFGGGTMLRLCHELNRYSADLDFWFIRRVSQEAYFEEAQVALAKGHEITDAEVKHHTLLFELRSSRYPKRLKIEIRREIRTWDYEKAIAFSRHGTRQVLLNAHTLEQTMDNKVRAFLDRGEIRDCFDIEFLLRRGVELPVASAIEAKRLLKKIAGFKDVDFRVKLGSILEKDTRGYYIQEGFSLLEEKLTTLVMG